MSFIPRPQEIYKHFKGNLYQILAIAEHSETGEPLVIYQALYGEFKIYARPLAMFTEKVDREKYPEVTQEYRFELQGNVGIVRTEAAVSPVCMQQCEEKKPTAVMPQETSPGAPAQPEYTRQEYTQPTPVEAEIEQEEIRLDPMVLEFLDADTYEQRLNILAALHHRITDEMITTMAIASDVEVMDGDIEERYESLKNCLLTLEKYESNRLR
ncbi:MAG: DUF1653 domain-containing protein [Lachnospiraceae bacterium]|nr:DUF1653 domain-containing protein [Lachnospiraceae bacterium]